MASKEQIAEMSDEERVEALNKAIKKQVKKHFDGSSLKAEIEIRVSRCDDDNGRIPTHVKDALNRMMKSGTKASPELASILLDELEKAAMGHPALKKDQEKAEQVKRMFAIRKELNELVAEEEKLVEEITTEISDEYRQSLNARVRHLGDKQNELLEELQAL